MIQDFHDLQKHIDIFASSNGIQLEDDCFQPFYQFDFRKLQSLSSDEQRQLLDLLFDEIIDSARPGSPIRHRDMRNIISRVGTNIMRRYQAHAISEDLVMNVQSACPYC